VQVLEPVAIPGLSLTADYYDIRIKDAIVYNTTSVIVAQCFASGDANNANCQAIHRSTLTGALSGGSGIGVDTLYANVAVMRTRGIDLGLNFHRGPQAGSTMVSTLPAPM
jgi:outer membrane receptor protein involved in Fe transport